MPEDFGNGPKGGKTKLTVQNGPVKPDSPLYRALQMVARDLENNEPLEHTATQAVALSVPRRAADGVHRPSLGPHLTHNPTTGFPGTSAPQGVPLQDSLGTACGTPITDYNHGCYKSGTRNTTQCQATLCHTLPSHKDGVRAAQVVLPCRPSELTKRHRREDAGL